MPTTFQNPQALTKCATEKPHSILHDSTLTPPQKPYRAVFGQKPPRYYYHDPIIIEWYMDRQTSTQPQANQPLTIFKYCLAFENENNKRAYYPLAMILLFSLASSERFYRNSKALLLLFSNTVFLYEETSYPSADDLPFSSKYFVIRHSNLARLQGVHLAIFF